MNIQLVALLSARSHSGRNGVLVPSLALICALLIGCDRDDAIATYSAPKDPAPVEQAVSSDAISATQPSASGIHLVSSATSVSDHTTSLSSPSPTELAHAAGLLAWTKPAGWEIEPPTSSMRLLSFRAGDSEVVISRFPKAAMSDRLMNINRWRGQVQLPSADDTQANPPTKTAVGPIADADFYEFSGSAGADAHSLLVAVAPQGESLWFFKFLGPAKEIEAQKSAFVAFLKSIQLGSVNE